MSGESFPNTPNIDQGQSGSDDGGYAKIMSGETVAEAPERDESTKFGTIAEGTEFGVNAELEAAADKILAEADAKAASAPTQERLKQLQPPKFQQLQSHLKLPLL